MIGAALTYIDGLLAVVLTDLLRVSLWGLLCGLLSMWLYAVISPQKRLLELREEAATLQKRLSAYEGALGGATKLIRQHLTVAFQRLGLALAPSLLAGLPVIVVILWLGDSYSVSLPKSGDWQPVDVAPLDAKITCIPSEAIRGSELDGCWLVQWPSAGQVVGIYDGAGTQLMQLPPKKPHTNICQRDWYHSLMTRQLDCLPADTAVEEIRLDLPEREFIPYGPPWLRSWLFLFFAATTVTALFAKCAFRIS